MVASAKEHNHMHLEGQGRTGRQSDQGYAMAALLVMIAIMAIVMTIAMPVWKHQMQREKEAELIFRAGQYAHAIYLYQKKFANSYPPNVDVLLKSRFLRQKYQDPITGKDFRPMTPQELAGTPTQMLNPGGGAAGTVNNQLGSGTPLTGQGLGSSGSSFSSPGGSLAGPGKNQPTDAFGPPPTSGPGGTINVGPVAAVVSTSTDQSIRIFKGRDHYNQWIVTIEDVLPRQLLRPQQPGQRPQQPGQTGQPGQPGQPSPTRPRP
jgi:type II secretory pathway pseudopilin PulG